MANRHLEGQVMGLELLCEGKSKMALRVLGNIIQIRAQLQGDIDGGMPRYL